VHEQLLLFGVEEVYKSEESHPTSLELSQSEAYNEPIYQMEKESDSQKDKLGLEQYRFKQE